MIFLAVEPKTFLQIILSVLSWLTIMQIIKSLLWKTDFGNIGKRNGIRRQNEVKFRILNVKNADFESAEPLLHSDRNLEKLLHISGALWTL